MYPRIAEFLTEVFGTNIFYWLAPSPAMVYSAAMIALLIVFTRRCHRGALSREHALGMAVWAMAGGIVGARVFYLVQHLPTTLASPRQILDLTGGTASWGAYLGALLAIALYCRGQRLAVMPYADVAASCAGIGIAIGRLSCFLNGDDFGSVSHLPWAVRYPHASIPFVSQVQQGMLDPLAQLSLPVHPVQLYLAANGLLLFWIASLIWRRYRSSPGVTFYAYGVLYALTRFSYEFVRGDQQRFYYGTLSVPQVMSLLVMPLSLVGLWYASHGHAARRRAATKGRGATPRLPEALQWE